MNRINYFGATLFLLIGLFTNAQNIVWTGSASNNDFFDEGNWKDSVTNTVPDANTLNPNQAINLHLQINTATYDITANGIINLGAGSLTIGMAKLVVESLSGGSLIVNEGAYVDINSTTPFLKNVQINFTSGISWVRTLNYKTTDVSNNNLEQINVNNSTSVYKTNLRLDNYYLKGCVIRGNIDSTTPLTVYDGVNTQGSSALITVNTLHSGSSIRNSMNNKTVSFILKKGFMVTFANEIDGTGKSKNYIASEEDLVINELPRALLNSISFIRVMPWNWVTKKGRTGVETDLNTTWRYRWNVTESSKLDWEYVPMTWGLSSANDDADITLLVGKYNSPHVMAFNESDNCFDQSGQYGNPKLCVTDVAVGYYKNLMKTGMRLVSPNCREEAPFGWLKEFYDKATAQDIRIDIIGVHWYDWGGNPAGTPNASAELIFNRFKAYLKKVHDLYGLPIWISEFNANPNRTTAVNLAFMQLALPYLETLDYVERYNWYQPNSGVANFYTNTTDFILTDVGIAYRDQISTPSIPDATVNVVNNLNLLDYANVALNKTAIASSSYSIYVPSFAVDGNPVNTVSQWSVNFGVPEDTNYFPLPVWIEVDLQGSFIIDGIRINEETKALKDFRFEVWDPVLASGAGDWTSVLSVKGNPATPLTTYKTFTSVTTTKVRLYITGHNSLDYLKLFELEVYGLSSNVLGVNQFEKQAYTIYPNPVLNGVLNIIGNEVVQSADVYTILGVKIITPFENGKLIVNGLSPGFYFLRVNNKYTVKFIKK
ncbi:MAG: discoidin domain-containing protein [Bacteroidia bacterium]|nr:discoidin domain-containing protein [Bacteroidia bacterium]